MHTQSFSRVQLFVTPWTVIYQTPLSMEFPRQEYWSVLPFPSPKDLPDSGIKSASPASPVLQEDSLPLSHLVRRPTWLLFSKTNICIYSKAEDFKTSASTSCPITAKFRGFNIPCLNICHYLLFCLTSVSWDPQHYISPKLHTLTNCKSIIYMPNKQISKCHQFIEENGPKLLLLISKFCITWSLSSLLLCYHTVKTLSLICLCLGWVSRPEISSTQMASISNIMLENFSTLLVAQFSLLNSKPHFQMFIGLLQFHVLQFLKFKETLMNHHLLYHPNLFLLICSLYPGMKLYCSNDLVRN